MIEEKFSVEIGEDEIIFFAVQLLCSYFDSQWNFGEQCLQIWWKAENVYNPYYICRQRCDKCRSDKIKSYTTGF